MREFPLTQTGTGGLLQTILVYKQPLAGVHESVVQELLSSQLIVVCAQAPPEQASFVQELLSDEQVVPFEMETQDEPFQVWHSGQPLHEPTLSQPFEALLSQSL